jgi:SAM-dependent methyltransferase
VPASMARTDPAPPFDPTDVTARWDRNAAWWDDHIGAEGNATQTRILGPATERLLGDVRGRRVLDIACGNGQFARRLADLGAEVVAVDLSEVFLGRARARSSAYGARIEFRRADVTQRAELTALGPKRFDGAVCTMAFMDIAELGPLFAALPTLLPRGAPLVFSVTHPAFNQTGAARQLEESDTGEALVARYGVRIDRYRTPRAALGIGIVGQPTGHWYFERSLSDLLRPAFEQGWCLDALEEPECPADMPNPRSLGWSQFREIPPFLVGRLRSPGASEPP